MQRFLYRHFSISLASWAHPGNEGAILRACQRLSPCRGRPDIPLSHPIMRKPIRFTKYRNYNVSGNARIQAGANLHFLSAGRIVNSAGVPLLLREVPNVPSDPCRKRRFSQGIIIKSNSYSGGHIVVSFRIRWLCLRIALLHNYRKKASIDGPPSFGNSNRRSINRSLAINAASNEPGRFRDDLFRNNTYLYDVIVELPSIYRGGAICILASSYRCRRRPHPSFRLTTVRLGSFKPSVCANSYS